MQCAHWVVVPIELKVIVTVTVVSKWGWFVIIIVEGSRSRKWRVECLERHAWRWDEGEKRRKDGGEGRREGVGRGKVV